MYSFKAINICPSLDTICHGNCNEIRNKLNLSRSVLKTVPLTPLVLQTCCRSCFVTHCTHHYRCLHSGGFYHVKLSKSMR